MVKKKRILVISRSQVDLDNFNRLLYKNYNCDLVYLESLTKSFKSLYKVIKKDFDKVIIISSVGHHYVFLYYLFFKNKSEIIYFPYDIVEFFPYRSSIIFRVKQFLDKILSRIIFLGCDKLIHKGLLEELSFLSFYKKIKDKPNYFFRDFLNPELVQEYNPRNKLSKKDGEIHLVYIGGLTLEKRKQIETSWKFFPRITKQKIHLHIYSKQPAKIVKKLKNKEKKGKYFHYEGFREHKKLIKEITKYDWGIHIFGKREYNISEKFVLSKVGFANKNYDYLSARLPIIVSDTEASKRFILNNEIGFYIKYKNLGNLKNRIKNTKYLYYLKNIQKFIDNIKNTKKLVKFIEK